MAITALPIVVQASAAKTVTGQTPGVGSNFQSLLQGVVNLTASVTAVSGTTPSMTLTVQWSDDGGTTWFDADPADTFTAITATGSKVKQFAIKAPEFRVVFTITGTTPSFTFGVKATFA